MGENFRFGHRARGDVALLQAQDAFATRVVELVEAGRRGGVLQPHPAARRGGRRRRARAGCWARRSSCAAPVAHGDKRGRTLGYPTANLVPDPARVCPAHGVYACRAAIEVDGAWQWWPAATSVGVRPTFVTGLGLLAEAFLLGFDGDLYGRELRLSFLARLRGEERFDSVEALVDQMARDVEDTRRLAA